MNKVKVLLLIPRKKDNPSVATEAMQHRKCFRKIWSDEEEREKRILELKAIAGMYPEYMWRIYETINWRDLRKTYYAFQQKMLDWQRSDPNGKMEWLDKVHAKWTSIMMTPECRCKDDPLFLIDKDDKLNLKEFEKDLKAEGVVTREKYETPNGRHYLVEPFNTQISFKHFNAETHTDGLRLVEVI